MPTQQTATTDQIRKSFEDAYKSAQTAVAQNDRQVFKSVPRGIQYDWLNNVNFNNIVYAKDKIPDHLLRLIERRNPVVGAVITLRIQQGAEYSHVSHNKDVPGWEVVLKDEKKKLSKEQEKQKLFLEELIRRGHVEDYEPISYCDMPQNFRERMTKFIRDRMLIDKVCWEIERTMKGTAVALWTLDGATIYPVLPGGYYGSTSQITAGLGAGYNQLAEKLRQARVERIPPVDQIAYVQELLYGMSGGGLTAAFRYQDLIYDIANEMNDVRYYKQGFSLVEKANAAVVAFINSLSYNSNGLSRGHIPKVAVAMGKESNYTTAQLEDLQDEWMANFEGPDGQWNIPLLNSDAKILNLMPNNRDMEYQAFMEFTGALICSIMGADPAEAGLRFNQAQNVLSENADGKQKFSKNRGLSDLLGGYAYMMNQFLELSGYDFAKDFIFRFNALTSEDKGFEADLRKKAVETEKTFNEIRKEQGLAPDPYGDIIANPQYIQYRIQKEQAEEQKKMMEQQGGAGPDGFEDGFGEDDGAGFDGDTPEDTGSDLNDEIGGMIDETVDDMMKARRIRLI